MTEKPNSTPFSPVEVLHSQPAKLVRKIEYAHVLEGWVVYRLSYEAVPSDEDAAGFARQYPFSKTEGFSLWNSFEHDVIKGGKEPTKERTEPVIVPPTLENKPGHCKAQLVLNEIETLGIGFRPYSAYEKGLEPGTELLFRCKLNRQFLTLDGIPLPEWLEFDHIDGNICDGAYDLDKALVILQSNPRVEPTGVYPIGRQEGVLLIQEFRESFKQPGFNKTITFRFKPTFEQMRQIVSHNPEAVEIWEQRRKAIFDLDLLGLRKAGAARCDDFYDRIED